MSIYHINHAEMGARIRKLREKMDMTQGELGDKCDKSASFIGHVERGTRKVSTQTLTNISIILKTTLDYIVKGTVGTEWEKCLFP